jgi:hypothetical protein
LAECERLIRQNEHPGIHYIPAATRLDPSHPFAVAKAGKSHWSNNPWPNLAVARSLDSIRTRALSSAEKSALNLWSQTTLADQDEDVYLDRFLAERNINSIDLCKIDIDGADFDILHSLESFLCKRNLLAVVIEVNYFGSDQDTDNTFHNIDRYMRRYGFDLYGLTVNKYSAKSLPAPYCFSTPGESVSGRPYQGDALYVLDVFSPVAPTELTRDKILKLVAIFALFDLPDWAAELLQIYGSKYLEPRSINQICELLALQIQEGRVTKFDYCQYISAFEKHDPMFYSGRSNKDDRTTSLVTEIAELRAEMAALRRSRSWRITAPARALANIVKKLNFI